MNDRIDSKLLRTPSSDLELNKESSSPCIDEHTLGNISGEALEQMLQEIVSAHEEDEPSTPLVMPQNACKESIPPNTESTAPYYPMLPLDLRDITHEGLVARCIELAVQFRKDKDYSAIREDFVRVSLGLNQFGLLAPVFRDQPKMPFKRCEWKRYTQLLIDQIVIDCHWMHCRGEKVSPRWPEFGPMFAPGGKFDCEHVAERIGAKNWKDDFRVNELFHLFEQQKVQLMQLRDKGLKEKFRVLLDGRATFDGSERGREAAKVAAVRVAINNYAANSRGRGIRGQEDIYEGIWLALELLGPNAKNGDIATLAALKCGTKPVLPRTMSDKVVTLRKLLGEVGITLGS